MGFVHISHPNTKQLADRLRNAREAAGLSIEDVGALLASRYVGTEATALKSGIEEIESIESGKEDVGRLLRSSKREYPAVVKHAGYFA